jgi:glutamate dehydrogenase
MELCFTLQKEIPMENEWIHPLEKKLRSRLSQDSTLRHMLNYLEGLSKPYIEKYSEEEVITDLIAIEKITESVPIRLSLYEAYSSTTKHLRIKIYQLNQPIPLSDALPLLENMGLRTISEELYEIKRTTGPSIWISDYTVTTKQNFQLTIDSIKNTFQDMFIQVYLGYCENDGFNTLCLAAGLTWREICIIRVYVKYLAQTGFRFSQHYIEKTLAMHPSITNALISLFILKHNPHHQQLKLNELEQLQEKIKNLLETVSSLDEDRILRRFFILINATLRTNFFQTELQGQYKNYITI